MKKSRIRLAALALCVLLFVTMLPATALASAAEDARTALLSAVSNGVPTITYQPKNQSVKQGDVATFQVKASGKNVKFQWYYRKNAKADWQKISGATDPVLSVTAGRMNGYQYRCRVYNSSGKVFTKTVTLKVNYVTYRALLIGEINFSWDYATRNKGDVLRMKKMLSTIKPPMGGSYNITCEYDLGNSGIKNAINSAFAGADSNDVSLFFIATHGVTDVSSGSYAGALATLNSSGDVTLLKLGTLANWLKAVPGKVIVIIGSCGSGAAVGPNKLSRAAISAQDKSFCDSVIAAFSFNDAFVPRTKGETVSNIGEFCNNKFYVLTAAMHMESSWGWEEHAVSKSYNYFPYWLTKGATGPADKDKNGKVTLNELFNYASVKAMGPYKVDLDEDGIEEEYYQHARVYPTDSNYILFKTP